MFVKITNLKNGREFAATFDTQRECETWAKKHRHKGADEKIIFSPAKLDGAEVLGEQDGPFGTTYKLKIPAEYKIEYFDTNPELIEQFWKLMRDKRDKALAACDWTQLADAPVDGIKRRLWREYRQYLRDLPTHFSDESIEKAEIKEFGEYVLWKHKKRPNEIKAL